MLLFLFNPGCSFFANFQNSLIRSGFPSCYHEPYVLFYCVCWFCFGCFGFVLFFVKLTHYSPVIAQNSIVSNRVLGIRKELLFALLLSELSGHFGRMCVSWALHSTVSHCDSGVFLSIISACWRWMTFSGAHYLFNPLVAKANIGRF